MTRSHLLGALEPFIIRNHLFAWADNTHIPLRPVPPEYQWTFPSEIASLTDAELADVEIDHASLLRRHQAGDLLGFVRWEGRIVYRILVQTRGTCQMEGDRYALKLGPGQGYVHSGFTALAHRGKSLHPTMMRHLGSGYTLGNLFVACRQENTPGAHAILRAGFGYLKSDIVAGFAYGRVRLRWWYRDGKMTEPYSPQRPVASPAT